MAGLLSAPTFGVDCEKQQENNPISSLPILKKLKQWETTHFPAPRTTGSQNPAIRYQVYRTEQGSSISLKKMKVPAASSQSQMEFIFSKIKTITSGIDPNEVAAGTFIFFKEMDDPCSVR